MRMMKVSAAPGSRVPNFESHAQGVPAWLEPGEVYEVPDASHWRKALAAGDVAAACDAARKYAPAAVKVAVKAPAASGQKAAS